MNNKIIFAVLVVLLLVFSVSTFVLAKEDKKVGKEPSKYQEAKLAVAEKQQELSQIKTQIKDCKENKCKELKQKQLERSVEYLNKLEEKVLTNLEKFEEKVSESNSEFKEKMLQEISDGKTKVEGIQTKISKLNANSTKKDVIALAKELKEVVKSVAPKIKLVSGIAIHAKLGNIVTKSEALVEKLEAKINATNATAEDYAKMQGLLNQFKEQVNLAKGQHKITVESFKQAMNEEDGTKKLEFIDAAKESQVKVKEYLKNAREILKELLPLIKESKK